MKNNVSSRHVQDQARRFAEVIEAGQMALMPKDLREIAVLLRTLATHAPRRDTWWPVTSKTFEVLAGRR